MTFLLFIEMLFSIFDYKFEENLDYLSAHSARCRILLRSVTNLVAVETLESRAVAGQYFGRNFPVYLLVHTAYLCDVVCAQRLDDVFLCHNTWCLKLDVWLCATVKPIV